jgi:hypothetical protein
MHKPFVKFHFFVPILQQTLSIRQLTNKMECMADNLKFKVLQFAALIIENTPLKYKLVESVFFFMHLFTQYKNG